MRTSSLVGRASGPGFRVWPPPLRERPRWEGHLHSSWIGRTGSNGTIYARTCVRGWNLKEPRRPSWRQQQTRLIKHHERHTWQQSAQRAASLRLEPGRRHWQPEQQTRLLLLWQSPVLYTCQLSLAILGRLSLEGLVLRLTT